MQRVFPLAALMLLLAAPPALADSASSYVELADAPTITVDWSKGNTQAVTLHGNRPIVFTNGQKGTIYRLIISQDATGSRTVLWPSSVRWPGNTPPVLTATASKTDYLSFFFNGALYDALGISQNH
jgi:hypothetical protein